MMPTMTTMSALSLRLVRRSLVPTSTTTATATASGRCAPCTAAGSSNNQRASWASSSSRGKQKRARAAKLREAALAKKNKGGVVMNNNNNKKSTAAPGSQPMEAKGDAAKAASKTALPPSKPGVKRNLPKALHMQASTLAKGSKGGWYDHFVKNPILYAGVIFPTVLMGGLILVKPNLREQAFNFGGFGVAKPKLGEGGSRARGGGNASVTMPKETPAAVYESGGGGAKEEEEVVVEKIVVSEVATSATNDEAESVGAPTKEAGGEIEKKEDATSAPVVDLFYAIGIRPHSS